MHISEQALQIPTLHFEPQDLIFLMMIMAWIICLQGPALTLNHVGGYGNMEV